MYADRKGWPLTGTTVTVTHDRVHAEDCRDCETKTGHVDRFVRTIVVQGPLDAKQIGQLREIADKCPVHRTLTHEIRIETGLSHHVGAP
jgi:putative redox protein